MIRTLECSKTLPLYPVPLLFMQMKSDKIRFLCLVTNHDIQLILSQALPPKAVRSSLDWIR